MKKVIDWKKISVWLLLVYTYLIWLRTIIIPHESFITPALLMLVLLFVLFESKGTLLIGRKELKTQANTWILIFIYICINNKHFVSNLLNHGMIQYFVMIAFMLLLENTSKWTETWVVWTKRYAILHAFATVFFYLNKSVYPIFANKAFDGKELSGVMKQFNSGWMPGICKNVSANGMVLSICFLVFAESFIYKKEKKPYEWGAMAFILFAFLLTGKRGPLLFIIISMAFVYLVQQKDRQAIIRFIKLGIAGVVLWMAFLFSAKYIPAVESIILKNEELSNGASGGLLHGRLSLWTYAIDMFKQSPIIGNGYWSYAAYAEENDAITTSAHNFYLQVLTELGIIGLVMYIVAFVSGIVICIKKIRTKCDFQTKTIVSIALSIQVFTILYGMSSSSLIYYYILIPYFLSCSAVRSLCFCNDKQNNESEVS